jgi:hypothetical protein
MRQPALPIVFTSRSVLVNAPRRPGAYVLGNFTITDFIVGYIGRSDESLRHRLAFHERLGQFAFAVWRVAPTSQKAFFLECEFWHAAMQQGMPLENRIHPAIPRGSTDVCPICHFGRYACSALYRGVAAA